MECDSKKPWAALPTSTPFVCPDTVVAHPPAPDDSGSAAVYTTGSSFHMATASRDRLPAATIWFSVCRKGLSVEFKSAPHSRKGRGAAGGEVVVGEGVGCSGLAVSTAS
jgi:hypothetical protein